MRAACVQMLSVLQHLVQLLGCQQESCQHPCSLLLWLKTHSRQHLLCHHDSTSLVLQAAAAQLRSACPPPGRPPCRLTARRWTLWSRCAPVCRSWVRRSWPSDCGCCRRSRTSRAATSTGRRVQRCIPLAVMDCGKADGWGRDSAVQAFAQVAHSLEMLHEVLHSVCDAYGGAATPSSQWQKVVDLKSGQPSVLLQ